MIKKYINKLYIFLQIIFIILLIKYTINNICHDYELTPGISLITEDTKSSWQIIKHKNYNKLKLSDFSEIEYYHVYSYMEDEYPVFKGHITLLDENKDIFAVFDKFLLQLDYYNFIFNFDKYVDLNNETYLLDIKESLIYLKFLNNCSNNSILYEKDNICIIKDIYNNNINMFIKDFFNEHFVLPSFCYNNKFIYKILYMLVKFTSILIILNMFTCIVPFITFIISYLKNINIKINNDEYIPLD